MFGGPEDLVLQAVVVCVRYSDFLAHTLPANLPHFDRLVVVTDHDDAKTADLCRSLSVPCVKTDEFYVGGDRFNKGRAINLGLAHLMPGSWIVQLDADIALPPAFRKMLRHHPLQKDCLYGADRINVFGKAAWDGLKQHIHKQYNYHYMVTPYNDEGTKFGSRFVHDEWGFCPIGYFQLWHHATGFRYPINQGSAEHTDVTFAMQFPRLKRHLIPELFVYHLDSDGAKMGQNWGGRKTAEFGAEERPYCK